MSNKQDPKNKKVQTSERRLLTLNELSRVTGGVTAPSMSSENVPPYSSSRKP